MPLVDAVYPQYKLQCCINVPFCVIDLLFVCDLISYWQCRNPAMDVNGRYNGEQTLDLSQSRFLLTSAQHLSTLVDLVREHQAKFL